MKKLLCMLLVLTLCLTALPFAVAEHTSGDYQYDVHENNTAEITRYSDANNWLLN